MTVDAGDDTALRRVNAASGPQVLVGAAKRPLASASADVLIRVVVDQHEGLPDSFELTFLDSDGDVLEGSGITFGSPVTVQGDARQETGARPLIEGEVTGIEGVYTRAERVTVVRGHTLDHRLQRVRRTRTFADSKDSDVASRLAREGGITVGTVEGTPQTHPLITQDNETDWQLLRRRAAEIGYEVGVADGRFYFRKARKARSGTPVEVKVGSNLLEFRPRVSSAGLVPEVEVRAWDMVNARAMAVRKPVSSAVVALGSGDAAQVSRQFSGGGVAAPGAGGELGPPPSNQAHVVFDRAVAVDAGSTQALTAAASALAEQVASGFAEAEGELLGDARVGAGTVVKVDGVPAPFRGSWTVTRARHVFDHNHSGGYRTWFAVSGRQDRSLLALAGGSRSGNHQPPTRLPGIVAGIVTAIEDPLGLARVKVALPWLSPDYESTWAPVAQLSAGRDTGALFVPEPGDQVVLAFEFGDLRRPYVLGSVVNKRTGSGGMLDTGESPGKTAIKAGHPASVIRRGFRSPSGNRLVFHDEGPPGGGRPTASQVVLATEGDKVGLTLDQVAGSLSLTCKPGSPPGTLSIECDGNVEIKAGSSGSLTIDGGTSLKLKGQTVSIEGTGPVAVKGKPVQLN